MINQVYKINWGITLCSPKKYIKTRYSINFEPGLFCMLENPLPDAKK